MKHVPRRGLAWLLAVVMTISLLPAATSAKEPDRETHETRDGGVTLDVTQYGADPSGVNESSTAVRKALEAAKEASADTQKTIVFPKGEYHFYADYSEKRDLYVSNTLRWNENRYVEKSIGILVEDLENITIDGGGSLFIFHGNICTIAAIRSKNVTFTNFSQDHASPNVVDVTVESYEGDKTAILFVPACYTYTINGTNIRWEGERGPVTGTPFWSGSGNLSYQQCLDTISGRMVPVDHLPFSNVSSIEQVDGDPTHLRVTYNSSSNRPGIGRSYQMRIPNPRMTPGTFFLDSENVTVSHASFHYLHGFGMVGQLSKNITLDTVTCAPRPGTGRTSAGFADFVQMSSVGGKVTIRNCEFSNPHDDPINIHGTFMQVRAVSEDKKTFTVRYMHNETWGFPQFNVGDTVDFSVKGTLAPVEGSERTVVNVVNPGEGTYPDGTVRSKTNEADMRTIIITLDEPIDGIEVDRHVVENVTYTPEVLIENCRFAEVGTRGILVTTRKPVVIRDNYFDRVRSSSIFISCDAQDWMESGHSEDVLITGNTFIAENTASSGNEDHYGYTAIIMIWPTNPNDDPNFQIHRNIRIEDNLFDLMAMPASKRTLVAKSVNGLSVKNNVFQRYEPNVGLQLSADSQSLTAGGTQATTLTSDGATQLNNRLFRLQACKNVVFEGNTYDDGLNLAVQLDGGVVTAADVTDNDHILNVGGDKQLPAVGDVQYFSDNPAVATVDANGVVTGISAGTAKICAYRTAGQRTFESNALTFTVSGSAAAKPGKIEVTSNSDTVDVDGTLQFTAAVSEAAQASDTLPADEDVTPPADEDVTASDDEDVTPPADEDVTASDDEDVTLPSDEDVEALAEEDIAPSANAAASVTWSVKDAGNTGGEATITQEGVLTGVAPGVVEVTATSGGVSGSKLVTINKPAGVLSNAWTINREKPGTWTFDEEAGTVTITAQPGGDWGTSAEASNFFLTDAPDGDFEITVRLNNKTCGQGSCWGEAGLVVFKDGNNYVSVDRKNADGSPKIAINSESNGNATEQPVNDITDTAVYLKIAKSGDTYTGSYSADGSSWTTVHSYTNNMTGYRVGFFACNAAKAHDFTFQDFKIGDTAVPMIGTTSAPAATNASVSSGNGSLELNYAYQDADQDEENHSLIAWYVADTQNGHYTRLENAGESSLPITAALSQKWVKATVVPQDEQGYFGAPVTTEAVQAPAQTAVPTDASLSSLTVSGAVLSPAFKPDILDYTVSLPSGAKKATLSATATQAQASVTGTGEVDLSKDETVQDITVTAPDGTTKEIYTITFLRAKSSDASLRNLTASVGSEQIAYDSETRFYSLSADTSAANLTFSVTPAANATVEVRYNMEEKGEETSGTYPLIAGLNHLELRVTAEDGITTALYRVRVMKNASNAAELTSLTVNDSAVPVSGSEKDLGLVQLTSSSVTLRAEVSDRAKVILNVGGKAVENGAPVQLESTLTPVKLRVVAEDSVSENVYTLTLAKPDPSDAQLYRLDLGGLKLSPAFDPAVTEYRATAYGNASVTLTAAAVQTNAAVSYEAIADYAEGEGKLSGNCRFFQPDELESKGQSNQVTVTVTSPDGSATKTYTVDVTVVESVYLSDLNWESGFAGDSSWNEGKPAKDRSWESEKDNNGVRPIKLSDASGQEATFEKGLGTHANSEIVYDLSPMGFTHFESKVGVSYYKHDSNEPHLNFRVLCDGTEKFNSGEMLGNTPYKEVQMDVTGVEKLTLELTQPSNIWSAHGNWADAKLTGNVPLLSETIGINIAKLVLEHDSHTIYVNEGDGHTVALHPVIKPIGATMCGDTRVLEWSSSDTTVATVNDGVVTAVSPGEAIITFRAPVSGVSATCKIIVKQKLVGHGAVSGDMKFGSELTVDVNDIVEAAKDHLSYQWYRGESAAEANAIPEATRKTYTPVEADIGSKLTVKITASAPYEGEITCTTPVINKADGPDMVAVPTHRNVSAEGARDGAITGLFKGRAYEYKLLSSETWIPFSDMSGVETPSEGQTHGSAEITGLGVGDYHVRRAADATHNAGRPSSTVTIVVKETPVVALDIPQSFEGGIVRANRRQIPVGDTVTLWVTPDTGFQLNKLTVTDADGKTVPLTEGSDANTYTFTMPSTTTSVSAVFVKKTYTIGHNLSNIGCDMADHDHKVVHGEQFRITLTPAEGFDMPRALTVTETDTGAVFTDYTYTEDQTDSAKRVVTFAHGVTRNITITADAVRKNYTVVYELRNGLTASGAPQTIAHGSELSVTLSAASGHRLPENVAVKVNGADCMGASYDAATGRIVIPGQFVTGNVVITAQGVTIIQGEAIQSVTIEGTARVGSTLTARATPAAATFRCQWLLSDGSTETPIPDATDKTYTIAASDEGKTIRVRITGTGDYTGELTSAPTAAVLPAETPSIPVTGITLDPKEASVREGQTVRLTATVSPENATNKAVTWTSSDETIATVDADGVVTGVSKGNATITATSQDTANPVTAQCQVTVTRKSSGGGGGSSGSGSSSSSSTTTTTTQNPDGTTTVTVTDQRTGTVTATTKRTDGGKVEKVVDAKENVTITVTGPKGNTIANVKLPAEIPAASEKFTDVPAGHWAERAIHQAAGLGLVSGVGNGRFNREGNMKRGDLAVVLWRLSNGSENYALKFDDVPPTAYYAKGIAWAAGSGVVSGRSSDSFQPEASITRQELAVMLYRYAELLNLDVSSAGKETDSFTDRADVASWAADSMAWCVKAGILQGRDNGLLAPKDNVTRQEVAVMLQRFLEQLQ